MPPVDRVSSKENQKRINRLESIYKKLNGNKIYVAILSLLTAIFLGVLTVIAYAHSQGKMIGEIRAWQISQVLRMTELKSDTDEKLSYLDVNGCMLAQHNKTEIEVIKAKWPK